MEGDYDIKGIEGIFYGYLHLILPRFHLPVEA